MHITRIRVALCASILTCGSLHSPLVVSAGQDVGSVQSPLVGVGSYWTENDNHIPLCWHELLGFSSSAAAEAAKAFVIQTIQDGWIGRLNLRTSWRECPTSGDQQHVRVKLRIAEDGYGGTTVALGMATLSTAAQRLVPVPNDPPGLLLGFQSSWNDSDVQRSQFRALILHEFGHILGFAHELHRGDGPANVQCYTNSLPEGATLLGPADPASIMGWSYCATAGAILSLNDVRAARSVYGRRDVLNRGVLLAGRFRNQRELNTMSGDDHRNTLIVGLTGQTRTDRIARSYQALDDMALAGAGAVLAFLREAKIRTDAELKGMSDDARRNTLIVEIAGQTSSVPQLQALNNVDLVMVGLGKDRSFIRGVLLLGKFRTWRELGAMSPEDQRNTLIVELANRTNQPGTFFQSLDDTTLAGVGAALVFLRESRLRTDQELKAMTADDIRNTLIVEIGLQTGMGRQLQGLSNLDLVSMAFGRVP